MLPLVRTSVRWGLVQEWNASLHQLRCLATPPQPQEPQQGQQPQQQQGHQQQGTSKQQMADQIQEAVKHLQTRAQDIAASVSDRLKTLRADIAVRSEARRTASTTSLSPLERLQHASRLLNELTGYSEVEHLKIQVTEADREYTASKFSAANRKQEYEAAVDCQIQLQRDLNKLLERKSTWSDEDVQRFAALCRDEGRLNNEVQAAHAAHGEAVAAVDVFHDAYVQAMRERYTAEQLWGDKIRRAATWYTWGLMGLQFVSFVAVVLVVEPRRVRILHERVKELLEQHEGVTARQVDDKLTAHLSSLQKAMEESRVEVVMQSLTAGAAGQGNAGQGQSPEQQVDLSKMMGAVVTFMDGVHSELVHHRHQLNRLEGALTTSQQGQGEQQQQQQQQQQEAVEGGGAAGVAAAHPGQQQGGDVDGMRVGGPQGGPQGAGLGQHQHYYGLPGGMVVAGRRLTLEQVVGVSAAVSAGVGALVGVLLATYFSSR